MLLYVFIFYTAWCTLLFLLQEKLIFPSYAIPRVALIDEDAIERIWIDIGEGEKVEGWYLPPYNTSEELHPAVMYFHGNAELIDFCLPLIEQYRHWGFAVLLPEYRSYGRSGGTPGEKTIAEDMEKFHQWLLSQPKVDPKRIVYHGRSLGGGFACRLAQVHPPKALILHSTFTNLASMTKRYLAPSFLLKHTFYSDKVIKTLDIPIFITHGNQDTVIPVVHGRKLHELAKNSTYYEVVSNHNDFPIDDIFWSKIREFLHKNEVLK